jgi:hypothetical protein
VWFKVFAVLFQQSHLVVASYFRPFDPGLNVGQDHPYPYGRVSAPATHEQICQGLIALVIRI